MALLLSSYFLRDAPRVPVPLYLVSHHHLCPLNIPVSQKCLPQLLHRDLHTGRRGDEEDRGDKWKDGRSWGGGGRERYGIEGKIRE